MTLEQFNSATRYVQRTIVKFHATPLLDRMEGAVTMKLYQLYNFYVEISEADSLNCTPDIQSLSVDGIDAYLSQIDVSAVKQLLFPNNETSD